MALALCLCARTGATPYSLKSSIHTTWRMEDGLPQNRINAILQSRDGYLWLATQDGLARFDGDRFTTFDTQNTPGLATNGIKQLLEDKDGDLWIAGPGGISRLHNGEAVNLTPIAENESEQGVSCQLDPSGTLWAEQSGVFYHDVNGRLSVAYSVVGYSGQMEVDHWAVDSHGVIYVDEQDGEMLVEKDGSLTHLSIPGVAGRPGTIYSITCDSAGSVWIGTGTGAYLLRGSRLIPASNQTGLRVRATIVAERSGAVWALIGGGLYQYINGRFEASADWKGIRVGRIDLSSDGNLLCRYNRGDAANHADDGVALRINQTFVSDQIGDGLAGSPLCAVRDWQNNLWIGSDNGLSCVKDGACETYTSRDGLPSAPIQCLFSDAGNHLFASAGSAGLYALTTQIHGRFRRIGGARITALIQTSYGTILGLWNGRIKQLVGDKVTDVGNEYGNSLIGPASTIAVGPNDDVWVTGKTEFVRTRGGQRTVVPVSNSPNRILASDVDREGRFWASASGHLYCIENLHVKTFSSIDGLPDIAIVSIHQDAAGAVWFGHEGGGLTRYRDGVFKNVSRRDGLYSDGVKQINEDNRRNLWIGSSRGVFRVSLDELNGRIAGAKGLIHCYSFGPADGASGGQATGSGATCRMDNADLWFSGVRGVVRIDANSLTAASSPVRIERVVTGGVQYSSRNRIEIAPGDGDAEFHFTALDYHDPQHLQFQYRLDKFDKTWRQANGARTATYTNLPPGAYKFKVRCVNTNSQWTGEASMTVIFKPHYYQTFGFKAICALAAATILMTITFVPVLRRRNTLLKKMQERLKEQNEELTASQLEIMNSQQLLEAQNEELIAGQIELIESQQALEKANLRLHTLAATDGLTGIMNHREFQERLRREWSVNAREGLPLSLLLIDVDHFKAYNDTYGHQAGDFVLIRTARILNDGARVTDCVARYGGEEFVAILHDTEAAQAAVIAERFRSVIAEENWEKREITVSIGVATAGAQIATPERLIEMADLALYQSKEHGRNRVTLMSDSLFISHDQAA